MTKHVLMVDDDREVREALGQTLELADLSPVLAASFIEAKDHIAADFAGVIVSDIRMPGRDGLHLLAYAASVDADLPVILLTGEGDIPMALSSMQQGAYAFLEKPCAPAEFLAVVTQALRARGKVLERRRKRREAETGDAAARMLFGQSALSHELRAAVRAVARTGMGALITGAPGSGTPKVAEVIHLLSAAANQPFVKRAAVALNGAGLDEAFAAAGDGTLFIDAVDLLPLPVQYALLERLEAGGPVRVLAGTGRDLSAAVAAGSFSADLYYRLDLMRVRVPSLRERTEDIPILFRHYVAQACEQANLPLPEITEALLSELMARDWPGNARALMTTAMRFALGLSEERLDAGGQPEGLGLAEQLARVERSLLVEALRRHKGHASDTAKALKLPRKTFYDKLARHGLRADDYRGTISGGGVADAG